MSRFLLIQPSVHDFKLYDEWMNPFGLMAVSSILKQMGHEVFFLDALFAHEKTRKFGTGFFRREEIPVPGVLKFMERPYYRFGKSLAWLEKSIQDAEFDAAFVGSFLTYWYPGAFEALRILKTLHPQKPAILGGIYATLCPDHAKEFSGADWIFEGPATAEKLRDLIKNLGFSCSRTPVAPSLDLSLGAEKPFFSLLLSSGCPYRCSYCASSLLAPESFLYSMPEMSYFEEGYRRGVQDLAFLDDALLFYEKPLRGFIESLEKKNIFLRYHTPNGLHLNRITHDTARFLKRAGFETLRFGLESLEPDWISRSGGKAEWETVTHAVRHLKDAGFTKKQLGIYLLLSPETNLFRAEENLRRLEELKVNLHLNRYSPIPGTPDFQKLSVQFPEILDEPLLQNDSVFLKKTGIHDLSHLYQIKKRIQDYNALGN